MPRSQVVFRITIAIPRATLAVEGVTLEAILAMAVAVSEETQ